MNIFTQAALLVAAHFLCDFSLQSDTMAREKSRRSATELQKHVPWYYWMLAHACVHGLAVGLVLQSMPIGLAEVCAHFFIDTVKCNGRINIHQDQALHLLSKALWVLAWVSM